jgi:AbrB family looped-hinge helix DNA binding protein
MNTKVSSKGRLVLPAPIRRQLSIEAGDLLDTRIEGNCIILAPLRKERRRPKIKISKITGMPVLSLGPGAPKITSEWVRDALGDFC